MSAIGPESVQTPKVYPPFWKSVFETFAAPIGLIHEIIELSYANFDRSPDYVSGGAPFVTHVDCAAFRERAIQIRSRLIDMLAQLKGIAQRTYQAANEINKAVSIVLFDIEAVIDPRLYGFETLPNDILLTCHEVCRLPLIGPLRSAIDLDISDSLSAMVANAEQGRSANNPTKLKEPSQRDIDVFRYQFATGKSQTELANDPGLMEIVKKKMSQGEISRSLKSVREWNKWHSILPNLGHETTKPVPVDPSQIELGARQDRRTPRQRDRRQAREDE